MATTFQDAIDHLVDYLGGTPTADVQRDCRRAILEAYRDLTNASRWSYLLTQDRLFTSPPQDTGTVTYVDATRALTLAGATWPAWAAGAFVRVGNVSSKVVARVSNTVVTLDPRVNFGADIDDPAEYKLYRDSYLLPADYVGGDQALYELNFGGMTYVHPRDWLFHERFIYTEGTPRCYTIAGDPLFPGRLLLRMAPLPDQARSIDYLYQRRPRALTLGLYATGTVTTVQGSVQVTGSGSSFASSMRGAVARFASNASPPTSVIGKAPAVHESYVASVTSATVLDLVDAVPGTYVGVAYTLSDPIDVEEGAMLNAFWRCCEKHISVNRTLKDKPSAANQYAMALNEARAADARSFAGRVVGWQGATRQRLRDMPITFNT